VNEARFFGSSPDNSKVHIHEMGHYLGLYHTFEGGCINNDCLTDGDRVCDTPPDASVAAVLCNIAVNTCSTDADDPSTNNPFRSVSLGGIGDQNDMIINHMDYGLDICRTVFTLGQKDRMVSALTLIRRSLLQSKGCEDLCPSPILLSFSPPDTSVVLGTNLNFTNTTTGATTYQWNVNGSAFSSAPNPAYIFSQQGKHTITLIASNGNNTCTVRDSITIDVKCSSEAVFSAPQNIKPGEAITFTNQTTGATSYEWFIDGTPVASTQNFVHTFSTPGGFNLSLVVFNGSCYDTAWKFVQVNPCTPGNQGDNWYFGTFTHIKFSDGTATASTLPYSPGIISMVTSEGCVSMSDASGNFIFFANGLFVVNRELTQMPNGSGLLGHYSTTQIATIQNPANPDRYYLFTLDAFGGPNGLRYSEIDMTLDGGLGDVVPATKNTFMMNALTEKITTVKHANGTDTWVIVHGYNSNTFYTYLVTSTGISSLPVASSVGTVHTQDTYNQNVLGQLKASPDGCKLALAISGMGVVELLDFNNLTGVVSNPVTFTSPDYAQCYGVEFSPNGSKLYIGMENSRHIYQFDLNAGNAAAITSSRYLVGIPGTTNYLGGFQIGPYGKIYVSRNDVSGYMAVINNPNKTGAGCDFVAEAFFFSGGIPGGSVPSFNQSYFYDPTPSISGPDTVCAHSQDVVYRISGSSCASFINVYTLRGNATITASSDSSVWVNFNQAGTDTLIVERTAACGKTYDTLTIAVLAAPSPNIKDTILCTPAGIVLDAGPGYSSYEWQDHSVLQTYTATATGKYWVTLTTPHGCSVTDTFHVLPSVTPSIFLGNDTSLCNGNLLLLDAGNYAHYSWQDRFDGRKYSVYLPGKYWVTVTDACGMSASDTIIVENHNASIPLGSGLTICPGETIVLDAGAGYASYHWQDGPYTQTYSVSSKGLYSISAVTAEGCTSSGAVLVAESTNCCIMDLIPNLVTLNGDGLNDTFTIPCLLGPGMDTGDIQPLGRFGVQPQGIHQRMADRQCIQRGVLLPD
jgi:PKD repeat protein